MFSLISVLGVPGYAAETFTSCNGFIAKHDFLFAHVSYLLSVIVFLHSYSASLHGFLQVTVKY